MQTPSITEQELAAASKNGVRISFEYTQSLLDRVVVKVNIVEDTTTTVAHAFLDGEFFLASGFSACVDPANFLAATGARIATENAMKNATQKLWELAGYRLWAIKNGIDLGAIGGEQ